MKLEKPLLVIYPKPKDAKDKNPWWYITLYFPDRKNTVQLTGEKDVLPCLTSCNFPGQLKESLVVFAKEMAEHLGVDWKLFETNEELEKFFDSFG